MSDDVNDNTTMNWGKHKGKRLGDVPADYLLWFAEQKWADTRPELLAYVNSNLAQLEAEAKGGDGQSQTG